MNNIYVIIYIHQTINKYYFNMPKYLLDMGSLLRAPDRSADETCGFIADSNIGWTGQENIVG